MMKLEEVSREMKAQTLDGPDSQKARRRPRLIYGSTGFRISIGAEGAPSCRIGDFCAFMDL